MYRLSAAVVLAVCLYASALPIDAQRKRNSVYGVGTMSCGTWLEETPRDSFRMMHISWVQGYVSGMGASFDIFAEDSPRHLLITSDMNAMLAYMDKYCRENPLKLVKDGALSLVVDMMPASQK